ncbi:MAG: hypothetical protein PF569_01530 [Candidatus Woesearchaeota archaeon]|jgi:hypothetical protein|nr:hypothetical protein [Candidatus Woesearchaeota archaeon]
MFKKTVKKVNKKVLTSVVVDNFSRNESYPSFAREFDVVEGGRFKIGNIGGDVTIYDEFGNITTQVDWQAGYTQEYSFIYEEKRGEIKNEISNRKNKESKSGSKSTDHN